MKATAAAATSGLQPWSDAMQGAAKVRDAYSQRSHELAQAAAAAQQTATALSAEAEQWRQLRSADETKAAQVESKAEQLQEQAKEAMGAAKENEKKAKKYLSIAKSIDESLPVPIMPSPWWLLMCPRPCHPWSSSRSDGSSA